MNHTSNRRWQQKPSTQRSSYNSGFILCHKCFTTKPEQAYRQLFVLGMKNKPLFIARFPTLIQKPFKTISSNQHTNENHITAL
ncbi:hypothetical protein GDO78_013979 [Eleutherodactylus coqui]|uniref:Uncharacterized protein n=1 Tax=Eleutherodactylus coqui TaxID=57060 RepID=A0A8J6EF46_ELECQ|nr:hypothetical protein GDO78_013979 [Eleutherodactylus coqui]